jgi:hypothetical protein
MAMDRSQRPILDNLRANFSVTAASSAAAFSDHDLSAFFRIAELIFRACRWFTQDAIVSARTPAGRRYRWSALDKAE